VSESDNVPSSSLGTKHNKAVISKLRTSTKIIRSMKEGLSDPSLKLDQGKLVEENMEMPGS
jgi:hypothetical protein